VTTGDSQFTINSATNQMTLTSGLPVGTYPYTISAVASSNFTPPNPVSGRVVVRELHTPSFEIGITGITSNSISQSYSAIGGPTLYTLSHNLGSSN
jgi:hypothetical protein